MDSIYGISRIETYLPENYLTSNELCVQLGFDINFIEDKIGVKKLFYVTDQSTSDLASEAVGKILLHEQHLVKELDILIVCTQTPDFQIPHTSAIVQKKCNLPQKIAAFDISLGCSGFIYGLNIIESFMRANNLSNGILVTAETYSKIIDNTDRNTKPLFSDAAAAIYVKRNGAIRANSYTFGSNGNLYEALIVKKRKEAVSSYLEMDGRKIFEFALSVIPEEILRCISNNGLVIDDIDYFVLHQASAYIIGAITRKLGVGEDKVLNYMHLAGNTVSSSIPFALKNLLEVEARRPLKIIICGFGVGLSWGACLLTIEGLISNEK